MRLPAALLLAAAAASALDPAAWQAHVDYLASAELKGRATGRPELDRAADYIAAHFRKAGLEPVAGGSYFQRFPVTATARLGAPNRMRCSLPGRGSVELALGKGWTPLPWSGSGRASARVVFAGYGITAPEYGYDDYEGIDARGRVVLVLRHEPGEHSDTSVFEGRVYTEHAQLGSKIANAQAHGAAAIVVVPDAPNHSTGNALEAFSGLPGPGAATVPLVQITPEVAEAWFKAAGRDWTETVKRIDAAERPASFAFPEAVRAHVETRVVAEQRPASNVAAYLPGETDEYVVVGAHYDHIGMGEQYSMAGNAAGTLHPGADDNASGVAGLLELAYDLAKRPRARRGVLFLAFAGEELGLLGSGHYVRNPLLPPAKAVAMLNLDMVGRVRDAHVVVGNASSGSTFASLLVRLEPESGLRLETGDRVVYGSSDHTSFLRLRVPVLFFFSGLHGDYHRPSDLPDKVDAGGATRLLDLVSGVIRGLQERSDRPEFVPRAKASATAADK